MVCHSFQGFPGGSEGKESAYNAGDLGSIPGLGRSPGEGNGNSLQYSCLENPMDGEAWYATVHGVARSDTTSLSLSLSLSPVDHILSDLSTMTCPSWVALRAWLGFIELDKAVVLV